LCVDQMLSFIAYDELYMMDKKYKPDRHPVGCACP
jgi:hypothetical protein